MKIVICICTCRLPQGLSRLLDAVDGLEFDGEITVVVVDNDKKQEGITVCEDTVARRRWPLIWTFESQPGISHARNTAVRTALEQSPDYIGFLDDDEVPATGWLSELLGMVVLHDADAAAGPILPLFDEQAPKWLVEKNYFDRQRYPNGARLRIYAGGNCLVRASCFVPFMPHPFDTQFGLSGGEDCDFFERFAKAGHSAVWADNALVHEHVTSDRLTKTWLRWRKFCLGQIYIRIERRYRASLRHDADRLARAVAQLLLAAVQYVFVFYHEHWRLDAELKMAMATGKLSAYLGLRQEPYSGNYRKRHSQL